MSSTMDSKPTSRGKSTPTDESALANRTDNLFPWERRKIMMDFDDKGWALIHYAAFDGFTKSIQKYVDTVEELLEYETNDGKGLTPLLVAVTSGNLESVECLLELGASVSVRNRQNHGVIELCALNNNISLIEYFEKLNHLDLQVWPLLIEFHNSTEDDEVEAAAMAVNALTTPREQSEINPKWSVAVSNGALDSFVSVLKSDLGVPAKVESFNWVLNMTAEPSVVKDLISRGVVSVVIKMMKNAHKDRTEKELLLPGYSFLCDTARVEEGVEAILKFSGVQQLIDGAKAAVDASIHVQIVQTVTLLSKASPDNQMMLGATKGAIESLVNLFDNSCSKTLVLALSHMTCALTKNNVVNQDAFVSVGGSLALISLARMKNRDVALRAIDALKTLAENNPKSQTIMKSQNAILPMINLIRKSRTARVQLSCACALWALAGDEINEQRAMATLIGVHLLVDLLSQMHEELHYIGSEGLAVLSQGPNGKQAQIGELSAIIPLARMLKSEKEYIVLSAIRTLRCLCVGVGYVTNRNNQNMIVANRGTKFLLSLMNHARSELIQIEAAYTFGCVSIGNLSVFSDIDMASSFSYLHILRLLYSFNENIRMLTGCALAAFAYNNMTQQKAIAECGGVQYECLAPFLSHPDMVYRINAAFQTVVLSKVIPDEEQAVVSARAIKILVETLEKSKDAEIQMLTCDCIARIAHTRAGIPAAIISINALQFLCKLLHSAAELVQGTAAIALGYLSFNHKGERQLLNLCRHDPPLVRVIVAFAKKNRLSESFMEGWSHYKKVGLPSIMEHTSLRSNPRVRKSVSYAARDNDNSPDAAVRHIRQFTMMSFAESAIVIHDNSSFLPNITRDNTQHSQDFLRKPRKNSSSLSNHSKSAEMAVI